MSKRLRADYLSFTGRIGRLAYWKRSFVSSLIAIMIAMLGVAAGGYSRAAFLGVMGIAMAGGLIVWASLVVRRFHDLGRNGWVGLGAVSLSGALSYAVESSGALFLMAVVASCVSLALFIYLGFVRGAPGPNAYGPNPHAPDA